MSFTGEGEIPDADAYRVDSTVLGKVYIPLEGIVMNGPARVRYEKHPWIERFELDGIKAAPARRTGIGTKDARGFVRSLSTIWSHAYDEYREYGGDEAFDAEGYFRHVARHFADMAEDELTVRMFDRFSGFAENMWREGSAEMLAAAMETVLPVLAERPHVWSRFLDNITDEFRQYIEDEVYGREDNGI